MVQLKVAPATLLLNAMFVLAELQIVVWPNEVTFGTGLTVTVMLTGAPEHEFAAGVTTYVTVPGVIPGLTTICDITDPPDAFAPVIPPDIEPTVQLKVAPATLLVRAILVDEPLQYVVGLRVATSGVGLTVIEKVCAGPSHITEPLSK